MGSVGEPEYVVADQLAGGGVTELPVVVLGCYDGELLDDIPVKVLSLNLLPGGKV